MVYNSLCDKAAKTLNTDSILFYCDQALTVAAANQLNPGKALIHKGNGYQLSGRISQAVECFIQAAKVYQEFGNAVGVATAYDYLSSAFINQQNHENAKYYFHKAIEIFRKERDSVRLAATLNNLGFEYYSIGQYDSALVLYADASAIYQKLNNEAKDAYCVGNSGLVYSKQGDLDKAEKYLLDAIDILEKYEDKYAVADFTIEYAYVLQRKGKMASAIKNAWKSFDIASQNDLKEFKRDASYRLSQIYEQNHRYDSAFHYLLIYYTYSDSIRNLESIQKTADLRIQFEVAQKQIEVDILQKNKTLQLIIIISLGIIILLAAGFIFLTYLGLKKNKKLNFILEERRKLLEIQSNELRELNRIKDRFFSIISHDLRAPITSLGGISYLIKESLSQDDKSLLNQATDYIDQTVISLTGLLENLLNWALSQQGSFPFKIESIDLNNTISEVVNTFSFVTQTKNQNIITELEDNLKINADRNSIMVIIRNLISNAVKFSNNGSEILIAAQKIPGNKLELRVADKGIGIPPEKIEDLFILKGDKSSRGTDNEKGLGLGLSLVQDFVTMNKGQISVDSKVGEGTVFTLHFPM